MALTKSEIIQNYLKARNKYGGSQGADLYMQLDAIVDSILLLHASEYDWEWLENASETLTFTGDNYVALSALGEIYGARHNNNELTPIDWGTYNQYMAEHSTQGDNAEYFTIFNNNFYPYKPLQSGEVVYAYGTADPSSAASVLNAMPEKHERLIWLLFDSELATPSNYWRSFKSYLKSAGAFYAAETKDRTEVIERDPWHKKLKSLIGS